MRDCTHAQGVSVRVTVHAHHALHAWSRTGYITRLRGYLQAPDTMVYYHNRPNTDDIKANQARQPKGHGRNYMEENPVLWTETHRREHWAT